KNWKHLSDFGKEFGSHGGVWECPDLFPMVVTRNSVPGRTNPKHLDSPGDLKSPGESKWVLLLSINPGAPNGGSGTQYFVGNFDGKNFTLDSDFAQAVKNEKAVWLDWGRDNYAGVTWSDIPKSDGRRLFLGWMSNWDYATVVPTQAWRSAMTLPRALRLQKTAVGPRLVSLPVKELETLRGKKILIDNQPIKGVLDLTDKLGVSPAGMEMLLEVELPEKSKTDFSIVLSNSKGEEYSVGFDAGKNEFYSDRTKAGNLAFSDKFAVKRTVAPRFKTDRVLRLHLYFDVASCELFADDGEVVMTDIFFPTEDFNRIHLKAINGEIRVKSGVVFKLK
ncbi:MAG: GH32 C-terminal domain-containing protein, partial [Phycisphaerae bacterium]|nr:GH32 C-terminal domain-containing protein [Saprospiraceae bacterium]